MDLVLALHSHLPYVLNHGRWPHGSDWICEAAVDTYLPLLDLLNGLEVERVRCPITLGITPILAAQLAHPTFRQEMRAFFKQRLAACDEAIADFRQTGEKTLTPIAEFWRGRLARLERLFDRVDGDLIQALRHHEEAGRIEIMSSAATHGFLPLLGRDESVLLQLTLGRLEHRRLFGKDPTGCWAPECAYRPRGRWQPHPEARAQERRPGIEEFLGQAGYRYFFTDSHLAQAGRTLGLYREPSFPAGALVETDDPLNLPAARSPYRGYLVSPRSAMPNVATLVRDPQASRLVWSRHGGYPGDGAYLEFHKIRFPGGLKFWRVTDPTVDLGAKQRYDPNGARARARAHAENYAKVLGEIAAREGGRGELIAVPFDTELFGHWWFEGVDFLTDLYRALGEVAGLRPTTAFEHFERQPPTAAVELAEGSWGANGDFSKWLNPTTEWTWLRMWQVEDRFWNGVDRSFGDLDAAEVLSQAARELLLAQSSDWQFIISSGTAADYAAKRFREHLDNLERLLASLESGVATIEARLLAADLRKRNDVFPEIMPALDAARSARATPALR